MADFSSSALANIQLKAEAMWTDGQYKEDYKAEVEALKGIKERQTARITELEDQDKDYTVKINWLDTSAIVAQAATANCDITVPQTGTKSKAVTLDIHQEAGFSFTDADFRGSVYGEEETVAINMLAAMQALDEKLASAAIAKAVAYAGTNAFLGAGKAYAAGVTTVEAAQFNRNLFAYLVQTARQNRMRNPYLISNGELYQEFLNATFDSGNSDGKGGAARWNAMQVYHDLFNFEAAATSVDLLLVNQGALAFASKVKYGTAPKTFGGKVGQTRYSIESMNLPGVKYEVYYEQTCVNDKITDAFKLQAHAGLILNPEGKRAGNTGVLAFAKGA